jgi:hypothetical protein
MRIPHPVTGRVPESSVLAPEGRLAFRRAFSRTTRFRMIAVWGDSLRVFGLDEVCRFSLYVWVGPAGRGPRGRRRDRREMNKRPVKRPDRAIGARVAQDHVVSGKLERCIVVPAVLEAW